MTRLFCLLLTVCLALTLAGCHAFRSKGLFHPLVSVKPLKVGIATDYPPLIMKKNGQTTGLELEFARGLAQSLDRPLELVELPREQLAAALLAKKIDIIMAGMRVADAHQQKLSATDPYLISGQVVLLRLDDFKQFGRGARNLSMAGLRLGVVAGSPGDVLIKNLGGKGTVSRYPSGVAGLRALIMDKIDVFVHDLPANDYFAARFVEQGLTPGVTLLTREPLAWAVRPDDAELRQAANHYLAQLQHNGTLERMLTRTIPFYRNTAYSPNP